MVWRKATPTGHIMGLLKKIGTAQCRHCDKPLEIGKTYMKNKTASKYGSKTKWYCMPCYERMFYH